MKYLALLVLPLALVAQDTPSPANVELFRDGITRLTHNPPTEINDAAARTREVLRLPLNANPNIPLADLQAAQTRLIRLNDNMIAESARAAIVLPKPELPAKPLPPLPKPVAK